MAWGLIDMANIAPAAEVLTRGRCLGSDRPRHHAVIRSYTKPTLISISCCLASYRPRHPLQHGRCLGSNRPQPLLIHDSCLLSSFQKDSSFFILIHMSCARDPTFISPINRGARLIIRGTKKRITRRRRAKISTPPLSTELHPPGGLPDCSRIRYTHDSISKWPPLRPLCLILKVFLQQRELNEVYSGGIGSYALLAMLIAILRSQRDCQPFPEHNLGILLVNFFDIYGRKLNTSDVGVSCNGVDTFFFKRIKGFVIKGRSTLLSIEDPQAPENDIGKNSFNYFQVRSAFAMAFLVLTNTKTILGLGPNRSILGTIIRPDAVLVERKGGSNGEVTFNDLLPGAGEPLQQEYDEQQGLYCNWQLGGDDEEPLPRGNGIAENGISPQSSGKKRKVSKEKKRNVKKLKENGDMGSVKREKKESKKEKGMKKQRLRLRHNRNGGEKGSPRSRTC